MTSQQPFRIVIVGGGTAGWLSAAFLSTQLRHTANRPIKITLVEASDIPTIGVGEATIPSLRQTLGACGIDEANFLTQCDATFKHGIRFVDWRRPPNGTTQDAYFHPFGTPITMPNLNPALSWARLDPETRGDFAEKFSVQYEMALAGQAPKHTKDRPYDGALSYAYHLDAGKLAQFLKERFGGKKVEHIIGKVTDITTDTQMNISTIQLAGGQEIAGDFFIDCTGFAARLINAKKDNPFIDKSSILFTDHAVTTRIPHDGATDIKSYTTATAQSAGWIWDIALQTRRGVGHVFSTKYMDEATARAKLAAYVNKPEDELQIRSLPMRIGYHQQQWRGNCVAIGLSSGFLEPLESTGIYLTEMANWALADLLPRYIAGQQTARRYNHIMQHHYENIVDFLKLHYCLSERRDSAFWRDNTDPASIPETLAANLAQWQDSIPSIYDFDRVTQCFSATNYQFILYGMGWRGHTNPETTSDYATKIQTELATRRDRLKQFVLRDTVSNQVFFQALSKS